MTRVVVFGASGRMGAAVCKAVDGDERFTLVGAVDPQATGTSLGHVVPELSSTASELIVVSSPDELGEIEIDAAVDFTVASSAINNLSWCADHHVHAVCGTTGMSDGDLEQLRTRFAEPASPNAVIAPNFAISAVLMMRFAELAAPYFDGVEIIELHHNQKKDAPSGTSLETARRIAAARGDAEFAADMTTDEVRAGARGGVEANIHVHSVRLPGLIAHQEVMFGGPGQTLSVRQDSYDRTSFMPGVLLALTKVASTPGLTVGLDALLDR